MVNSETVERITRPIEPRRGQERRQALSELPAPEVADLLRDLDKADRVLVFRLLRRDASPRVFSSVEPQDQKTLLTDLSDERTRQLVANLRRDDGTHLLEEAARADHPEAAQPPVSAATRIRCRWRTPRASSLAW